jgi:hypothetical protein
MGVVVLFQVPTSSTDGIRSIDYPVGAGHIEQQAAKLCSMYHVRIEGRDAATS